MRFVSPGGWGGGGGSGCGCKCILSTTPIWILSHQPGVLHLPTSRGPPPLSGLKLRIIVKSCQLLNMCLSCVLTLASFFNYSLDFADCIRSCSPHEPRAHESSILSRVLCATDNILMLEMYFS